LEIEEGSFGVGLSLGEALFLDIRHSPEMAFPIAASVFPAAFDESTKEAEAQKCRKSAFLAEVTSRGTADFVFS
jgi:hypothetical protein